jgi:hypothetical protein
MQPITVSNLRSREAVHDAKPGASSVRTLLAVGPSGRVVDQSLLLDA